MKLFALTVFLSAFLLFQVQPIIGKYILPWFGSTPGVWTACLLFFQILLLAGYAYAHLIVSKLSPRGQAATHLVLLGLALIALPITPAETWKPQAGDDPTWHILLLLLSTVGAPFLVLSSTGPLLQGWFSRLHPDRSPYRLYALSNLGSLLALVTYPLFVERYLRLESQTIGWSLCWILYGAAAAACACRLLRAPGAKRTPKETPAVGEDPEIPRPRFGVIALWIALAACGSGMLMATTNHICQDVATFPLLWVLPLGLYLLSFIICFDRDRWYVRPLFSILLVVALAGAVHGILGGVGLSIAVQVGLGAFALFICCMCCHGELVRLKPHPRYLTLFYLAVSAGGAIGGLFVAVVSPAIFPGFWEYPLLLLASYCLVLVAVAMDFVKRKNDEPAAFRRRLASGLGWCVFGALVLVMTILFFDPGRWPWLKGYEVANSKLLTLIRGGGYAVLAISLIVILAVNGRRFTPGAVRARWSSPRFFARCALLLIGCVGIVPLAGMLGWQLIEDHERVIAQERNFYGVLKIVEYSPGSVRHNLTLRHGRIRHGYQLQDVDFRAWPTTYFGPQSGIGLALRFHPDRFGRNRQFRIGVIGLGVGTIAAYANADALPFGSIGPWIAPKRRDPGDYIAFYEINPMVEKWSREYFSYQSDAEARGAEVVEFSGDARLIMERQLARGESQELDVLAIDAFSGDAIPVHLLTNECMKIYLSHVRASGILAFHITNRYLDLEPVVRGLAEANGLEAVLVENEKEMRRGVTHSDWVLVTRNRRFLEAKALKDCKAGSQSTTLLWTDDFSSLLSVLKSD